MEVFLSAYWISFFLAVIATFVLTVRFFFLYSDYMKLNSLLPGKTEDSPVAVKQQDSSKNETKKTADNKKSKSTKKKTAKKKPLKKSKKKKG